MTWRRVAPDELASAVLKTIHDSVDDMFWVWTYRKPGLNWRRKCTSTFATFWRFRTSTRRRTSRSIKRSNDIEQHRRLTICYGRTLQDKANSLGGAWHLSPPVRNRIYFWLWRYGNVFPKARRPLYFNCSTVSIFQKLLVLCVLPWKTDFLSIYTALV